MLPLRVHVLVREALNKSRKAPSLKGCAKIERSFCLAPWCRRLGYDLRRASHGHLDFPATRLMRDLFRASLDALCCSNR